MSVWAHKGLAWVREKIKDGTDTRKAWSAAMRNTTSLFILSALMEEEDPLMVL
jgi:hypothetical protein